MSQGTRGAYYESAFTHLSNSRDKLVPFPVYLQRSSNADSASSCFALKITSRASKWLILNNKLSFRDLSWDKLLQRVSWTFDPQNRCIKKELPSNSCLKKAIFKCNWILKQKLCAPDNFSPQSSAPPTSKQSEKSKRVELLCGVHPDRLSDEESQFNLSTNQNCPWKFVARAIHLARLSPSFSFSRDICSPMATAVKLSNLEVRFGRCLISST